MAKTPRKGSTKATGRDYSYDTEYQASPEQKKNRAARNAARAKLKKEGKVKKGQDVDHQNSDPRDNSPGNLRVMSASKNRGRTKNGKKV